MKPKRNKLDIWQDNLWRLYRRVDGIVQELRSLRYQVSLALSNGYELNEKIGALRKVSNQRDDRLQRDMWTESGEVHQEIGRLWVALESVVDGLAQSRTVAELREGMERARNMNSRHKYVTITRTFQGDTDVMLWKIRIEVPAPYEAVQVMYLSEEAPVHVAAQTIDTVIDSIVGLTDIMSEPDGHLLLMSLYTVLYRSLLHLLDGAVRKER